MAAIAPEFLSAFFPRRGRNTGPDATLLSARRGVMFFFLLDGTVLGNWFVRIPDIQRELQLSHSTLGLALLASAAGALITQPLTGWLVSRWGSRRITIIGALAQCSALVLPSLAPGFFTLVLALLLLGGATGIIDVAMNVQGADVERRLRRPIMTTFHAFYSLGGVLGALTAGAAAGFGVGPTPHLLGVALVFGALVTVAKRPLLSAPVIRNATASSLARPSGALVRLGAIAFCVVLAEGAIGDWSAIYMQRTLAVSAGSAAGGYAAFSLAMTAGRLSGGHLSQRLGEVALMRMGGALVTTGLLAVFLAHHPAVALAGFSCVGIGLSCSFPLTISAASRIPGTSAGVAIATVNTAGYTGFLAGPPLIGFVAEGASLAIGLGILALVGLVMARFARHVGRDTGTYSGADVPSGLVTPSASLGQQ